MTTSIFYRDPLPQVMILPQTLTCDYCGGQFSGYDGVRIGQYHRDGPLRWVFEVIHPNGECCAVYQQTEAPLLNPRPYASPLLPSQPTEEESQPDLYPAGEGFCNYPQEPFIKLPEPVAPPVTEPVQSVPAKKINPASRGHNVELDKKLLAEGLHPVNGKCPPIPALVPEPFRFSWEDMDPELAVLKRNTAHLERILGIQLYFEEPCLQTRAYRRKKYVLR